MKYIDAERLKELLEAKYKEFTEKAKKDYPLQYQYMADGLNIAEQITDSLQQEQPEVDIKKELHAYICSDEYMNTREDGSLLIARHFFELGRLNARKEESK